MSKVAYMRARRAHSRRELVGHLCGYALIVSMPVAALCGAVLGSAWGNDVPVSAVLAALLLKM